MNQQQIVLKNDLAEIETMTAVIEQFGEAQALPLRVIFDMNLVLEEIITNIISYGYDDELEHSIMIELSWDNGLLALTVTDDAKPFDPLANAAPDLLLPLEEREAGGLGIFFVKEKMDEVTYKWEQGHNILAMKKKYAPELQN
ncbi:MAG: RsbW [Firmicutes bacterium]|nr:RsbW [Bacillota bacterium]